MDIRSFFKSSTGDEGKGPSKPKLSSGAGGKNGKGDGPNAGAKNSPKRSSKAGHNTGASEMT